MSAPAWPPGVAEEVAALAARYGEPRRVLAELSGAPFDPLGRGDRYGEVCMVIRRRSGRLLTAIKDYYPPGCFRLLTGGVGHGEPIAAALAREVDEETGLDVAVRRLLAVVDYRLPRAGGPDRRFVTFAFLLDELGGELAVRDETERHAAFREVWPAELPAVAARLEAAPAGYDREIDGSWRDWGRFRAIVHRAVASALRGAA